MIDLARQAAFRPLTAWKAMITPVILLICSVSVQAGAAIQQTALAGAVAQHTANLSDATPDNNGEIKAAPQAMGSYRRALQQPQINVWHTVQWHPSSGAQTSQIQQEQQQLPGAYTDGIQLLLVSSNGQPIHLQPAASGYRPSQSVIIGCIVTGVLLALMLLYCVLHRLFPHIFHMWQNDSDAGVSFSSVSEGIEVMAIGSAFATKPHGIPQSTLDKIPVVKYRIVCKHGLSQQLTERCSAVALPYTASPRCRRPAAIQPGSSLSSTAAAAATAEGALNPIHASVLEPAVEQKVLIRLSSAAQAAADEDHPLPVGTDSDAAGVVGQLAHQNSTSSSPVTQHAMQKRSTFDRLGWSMLGTSISGQFSRSSSTGGWRSNKSSCGGRRSSGGQPADDICAICHEEFTSNDDVRPLPCRHYYHPDCINAWLELHDTCPLCKAQVMV